jgi:hypothetical protein
MTKRNYPRAIAPIMVQDKEKPDSPPRSARDISTGGLFLVTEQRWEPGMQLQLLICHEKASLEVEARVIRNTKGGVALSFINLHDEAKSKIELFISALLMSGAELDEQRMGPRMKPPFAISLTTKGGKPNGNLMDLSLTGARVASLDPPPIGEEVTLYLPSDWDTWTGDSIQSVNSCTGRVVRHTQDGYAIVFESPSVAFRKAISNLRKYFRQKNDPKATVYGLKV